MYQLNKYCWTYSINSFVHEINKFSRSVRCLFALVRSRSRAFVRCLELVGLKCSIWRCSIGCSVICISLNLFKNVRAVEMFVWLLGLVVRLSVCWLRGRLLRISFSTFFLIRERPRSRERTSCSPHIFTSIFPPHAAPESQTLNLSISHRYFSWSLSLKLF